MYLPVLCQNFIDPETPTGILPDNEHIGAGWTLDFSDEFNGTEVDTTKWTINNSTKTRKPRPKIKVEKWFWRPENVEVRDGNLVLKVKKENSTTMHCGSIYSRDKYMTQYGYFEARIQIADVNKGTHTAFWLQGPDMGTVTGNGHNGAEIDIFESAWTGDHTSSVIHIDGYGQGANSSTKQYSTPGIHKGFHTWGMLWTKDYIKIYYDGEFKVQYTGQVWIPRCEEYLWLSDGASFGVQGDRFFVDQPLGWLTEAYVDYVRVWKLTREVPEISENVLQNGTFSNNGSNWSKSNSDIAFDSGAEVAISGITCRMPGAAKDRAISQVVDVQPNKTYEFSFRGRIQNAIGSSGSFPNNHEINGQATLKGEIITADSVVLLSLHTKESTTQELSGKFTVPEGITAVVVKISKDWNIAYVDDVVLISEDVSVVNQVDYNSLKLSTTANGLMVTALDPIKTFKVYTISGQAVVALSPNQSTFSVGKLLSGLYIVDASCNNGMRYKRKVLIP